MQLMSLAHHDTAIDVMDHLLPYASIAGSARQSMQLIVY
jgi:hypothetical protein